MPEARDFLDVISLSPTYPHKHIDETVIDVFMERLRNNEPSIHDSSTLTINISSDLEYQYESNPNLEEYDDLVRQFELEVEVIAIP